VVPDLSWLMDDGGSAPDAVNLRAIVLVNYLTYLISMNDSVFAGQLDPSRIIVVGHSTGGRGATHAARTLAGFSNNVCACGLIAPENGGDSGPDIHNLLVIGGTLDHEQFAQPLLAYEAGGTPKAPPTTPAEGSTFLMRTARSRDKDNSRPPRRIWSRWCVTTRCTMTADDCIWRVNGSLKDWTSTV
jgi:pimeloyl-ACP methyl ester carboxylesterase